MNIQIDEIPIGEQIDWSFGLITREVMRISNNEFEIHDFSDGWTSSVINKETITKLTTGEINILEINFT